MAEVKKITVRSFLILSVVTLVGSGAAITGDLLADKLPPVTLSAFRFLLASFFLYAILIIRKEQVFLDLRDLPCFIILALTGIVFYNILLFYGLRFTDAVNCSIITSTSSVIMYMMAVLFLKETFSYRHFSGILLSVSGVLLVITAGSTDALMQLSFNPGDLIILSTTVLWAFYSISGQKLMDRYSPLVTTTITCTIGTVILLMIMLVKRTFFAVPSLSFVSWSHLLILGVLSTGLAFYWWYEGIKESGAGNAAIFLNIVPVTTLIYSQLILHQPLSIPHFTGVSLIVAGLYLIT